MLPTRTHKQRPVPGLRGLKASQFSLLRHASCASSTIHIVMRACHRAAVESNHGKFSTSSEFSEEPLPYTVILEFGVQ